MLKFLKHGKRTVFSPWTGKKVTLKELCYQIAEKINMNYKTAKEYDDRTVTASGYDGAKTTAYDFDWTKEYFRLTLSR